MKTFCLTDPGKVRDHNEDSVIIINNYNNEYCPYNYYFHTNPLSF